MTTEEVREILRMAQLPVSLEKPIGEEEESSLGDFVPDEQAESPFDTASLSLRREDIENALSSLPERERQVIELRFGLERRAAVHARGGRPRVRRHARADPPDREQHAQEARVAAGGAGPQGLRVGHSLAAAPAWPAHVQPCPGSDPGRGCRGHVRGGRAAPDRAQGCWIGRRAVSLGDTTRV